MLGTAEPTEAANTIRRSTMLFNQDDAERALEQALSALSKGDFSNAKSAIDACLSNLKPFPNPPSGMERAPLEAWFREQFRSAFQHGMPSTAETEAMGSTRCLAAILRLFIATSERSATDFASCLSEVSLLACFYFASIVRDLSVMGRLYQMAFDLNSDNPGKQVIVCTQAAEGCAFAGDIDKANTWLGRAPQVDELKQLILRAQHVIEASRVARSE
jgi:hypothetical protein